MAALQARDLKHALWTKMEADIDTKWGGDDYYVIRDSNGWEVASTSFSRGGDETLGPGRVSSMWKQLHLDSRQSLLELAQCPLSQQDALEMMGRNYPPGTLKRN